MAYERRNPITGKVASQVKAMSVAEAQAIADRAAAAAPGWAAQGPNARRSVLRPATIDVFFWCEGGDDGLKIEHFSARFLVEIYNDLAASSSSEFL